MRIFMLVLSLALLPNYLMAAPAHIMEAHKKNYTVAITQIVDHPVLNQAYDGILKGLKEEGYQTDKNLTIIYKNANGDSKTNDEIAQDFVKQKVDLIIPISTASAQAVINADKTAHIPVVFSAVTDPVGAQLVPKLDQPGGFVTGVYDFPPVDDQIRMIQQILPNIKTLGVIYNPNEDNSNSMIAELKKIIPQSIKVLAVHANAANQVESATNSLMGKVDAIYVPADNTVVSQITLVINIANKNHIPVFASERGSVEKGALAALAYDQYEVGYLSGRMAGQILAGKNPGTMDVVKPKDAFIYINRNANLDVLKFDSTQKVIKI